MMMTSSSIHYVEVGHTILRLDCQFQMDDFSLFVNPIFWRKRQLDDEPVPINFQGNVLEPFLSTKRFNAELASSSDRRRYNPQLTIYGVTLEDSGNYTCEVHGRRSVILTSVTHTVHVTAPLRDIYFATDPVNTVSYLVSTSRGGTTGDARHGSTTSIGTVIGEGRPTVAKKELRVRELNMTAGVPTSLRCVAIGGGYPVPELRVVVSGRDITARYFRRTTKATLRLPTDGGLGEEEEVATGLRLIEYRTELIADRLVLEAGDDGAVVRCSTASTMTSPSTGLDDHVTNTDQSASLNAYVYHVPRIDCSDTSAALGAREVFLRCEVVARPQPTALYWQLQPDSLNETAADGRISHGRAPPQGEHLDGDGYFWTVATDRSDGCLETRLYIGKVLDHSFRWYTVVAENNIGTTKTRVRLTQDFKSTGGSKSPASGDVRRNQHHRGSPSKKHANYNAAGGGSTDITNNGDDDYYYENAVDEDAGTESGISGGDVKKSPKHRGNSNGHQRLSSTDRRSQTSHDSHSTSGARSSTSAVSFIAAQRGVVWNALVGRLVQAVSVAAATASVVILTQLSSRQSSSPLLVELSCALFVAIVVLIGVDRFRVRTEFSCHG